MQSDLINNYINESLSKLDNFNYELIQAEIDIENISNKIEFIQYDPINKVDFIFAIISGILGGYFSNSEKIKSSLDKVHTDASKENPQTFLGKIFHHKKDNIDAFEIEPGVREFLKRDFQEGSAYLHRLYFGHDIFSLKKDNPFYVLICQKGPVKVIIQAIRHLCGDLFSKGGMPLPFSSWFDYLGKDGNISNWFDTLTKIIRNNSNTDLNINEVFRRLFTINMQDILSQGLTWALIKAFIAVRGINDSIYASQLRLMAYSSNFFSYFFIGYFQTGVPSINWPSLTMSSKEFLIFMRANYKDIKCLEKITDRICLENDEIEKQIFHSGLDIDSFNTSKNPIEQIDNDYLAFLSLTNSHSG
jgi:hypothetical protein